MEKKKSKGKRRKKKSRRSKEKSKLNSSDWIRQFSAGGVVYKKKNNQTTWLVIQPKGTNRWQLPKGIIDKGEKSKKTALREVQEEGGIKAKLIDKVGNQQYFFYLKGKKIFKTVTFYLMKYQSDTENGIGKKEIDKAKFVNFDKALQMLTFDNDKQILQKAKQIAEAK